MEYGRKESNEEKSSEPETIRQLSHLGQRKEGDREEIERTKFLQHYTIYIIRMVERQSIDKGDVKQYILDRIPV